MRPVDKSVYTENQEEYNPFGIAKPDLIKALGNFCSYCERQGYSSALDVEHIHDKSNHPDKKTFWSNFLIGCKNCNPIKGTKVVDFETMLFPDRDDTFSVFEYLESGYVKISSNCSASEKTKVKKLVDLIGLDRRPGHPDYSWKDERWQERKDCWELTNRYLKKYQANKADIETIVDLALNTGFWSIWMATFDGVNDVKTALINGFNGTNKSYF